MVWPRRFPLVALILAGCATTSGAVGFDGSWHGTWDITFKGSDYTIRGRTGHFASDASNLYFTEAGLPETATVKCPYTLMGDTLMLRECPYAGEYKR
jgi:hypothetical protein